MAVDVSTTILPPSRNYKDLKTVLTEPVKPGDAVMVKCIGKPQHSTNSVAVADLSAKANLQFAQSSWTKWGRKMTPGKLYMVEGFEVLVPGCLALLHLGLGD